jgi:hypothetical protein
VGTSVSRGDQLRPQLAGDPSGPSSVVTSTLACGRELPLSPVAASRLCCRAPVLSAAGRHQRFSWRPASAAACWRPVWPQQRCHEHSCLRPRVAFVASGCVAAVLPGTGPERFWWDQRFFWRPASAAACWRRVRPQGGHQRFFWRPALAAACWSRVWPRHQHPCLRSCVAFVVSGCVAAVLPGTGPERFW